MPNPPINTAAERLIASGSRPTVLGTVFIASAAELPAALFETLAHVSVGADGIDLSIGTAAKPGEQLAVADQLAEAADTSVFLRSEMPMAVGAHTLILPIEAGRVRSTVNVVRDLGVDGRGGVLDPEALAAAWPEVGEDDAVLVRTVGFRDLGDAGLMGLSSLACNRNVAAVSTDRVRIVRRVVDTLAPLTPTTSTSGGAPCR